LIDLHLTEDANMDTVRGAVRAGDQVQSALADRIRQTIQSAVDAVLDGDSVDGYALTTDVGLVADRVPGAPRERVEVALDFEGDDGVVAAIDNAVDPPDRARLADDLEQVVEEYLREHDLAGVIDLTVSVTPIEFR
jgi:hypothetical protein